MYKKFLCLFLLICFFMFLFSCSQDDNRDTETNFESDTEKDEKNVSAMKQEIENYEQEIGSNISYSSQNEVASLKTTYFAKIDESSQDAEDLKKECLLKMELIYIADIKNQKLSSINGEYDTQIEDIENVMYTIKTQGYYTGSYSSYNSEISSIDKQLREISSNREKEKQYVRNQAAYNGMSNSGWLQNELNRIDDKYNQQREELTIQKQNLQALWENKRLYDEGNTILTGLKNEKAGLVKKATDEYLYRKNAIDIELSNLKNGNS